MTAMTNDLHEILNEFFHHCALVAFVEQAVAQGGWPDPELTRQRAYALYETEKRKESPHDGPLSD